MAIFSQVMKRKSLPCFALPNGIFLTLQKLDVIYCLTFPGCNKNYFEKINNNKKKNRFQSHAY